MLHIDGILGSRLEPKLSEELHRLELNGAVEIVHVPVADLDRRRLMITTRGGEQLAIALPRNQKLFDGAVLLMDGVRAIVVRAEIERWLRLAPRSTADAVVLGYHAGNLHWRVRFDGESLLVALEGPAEDYLARLHDLIHSRRVTASVLEEAPASEGGASDPHPHNHPRDHSH